ncbi:hypothetical protein FEM48_ZijujUnG0087000 [Ziziphus jujuba var. spinosa]|uniref:Regulator of rDNA transcription protein 15 n=1 Tax=Ziziphus jujuba var. spinosa TaxID=714518 RepID=A0A978U8K7_ZIZJJ|nr:hypothetical protein FEM48_ZijujUnG0087000 [Ziziphus jujuba var. spinosa]
MGHRVGIAWGTVGIAWGIVGIAWGIGGHRVHRMGARGHRMGTVGIAWGIDGHRMGHRPRFHGSYSYWKSESNELLPSFVPHEISVLVELILGHLRYLLTDVPPQPNSPPDNVFHPIAPAEAGLGSKKRGSAPLPIHGISKITLKVVVFHFRRFRLPLILHLSSHFTKSD